MRNDIPEFKAGDTLKVFVKIKEGEKFRIQLFEGVCIARKGSGISESFTVRKISYQVGVERTFPVHTPIIDHIEVVKVGKVRRAKLGYLRGLSGKAARIKELENRNGSPFFFQFLYNRHNVGGLFYVKEKRSYQVFTTTIGNRCSYNCNLY